jgi:hypothetical protein
MDPTLVLASQKLERPSGPRSKDQIDAFYDEHGRGALLRMRRWLEWLRTRVIAAQSTKTASLPFAPTRKNV